MADGSISTEELTDYFRNSRAWFNYVRGSQNSRNSAVTLSIDEFSQLISSLKKEANEAAEFENLFMCFHLKIFFFTLCSRVGTVSGVFIF